MSPRVYQRKFDWDEAKARVAAGESVTAVAHSYGVTWAAVKRVIDQGTYERMDEHSKRWQRSGTCANCGRQNSHRAAHLPQPLCWTCASLSQTTTARADELRCVTCHEWKPDSEFAHDRRKIGRRGRHRQCRDCNTIAKRAWRARTGRD